MKTIALISLIILAGLLLVPTSQAAPSCCDPKQAQGQTGMFWPAPVGQASQIPPLPPLVKRGKGGFDRQEAGPTSTFPVAPRNSYVQPVPKTTRAAAPGPRNVRASQPVTPYYPAPVVPAQTVSVNPPIAAMAAGPRPCGCGIGFEAAGYPPPSASCCAGRGLNVPTQTLRSNVSVPSCCAGQIKPAAPVSSCCAGRVKAAQPVPSCCAGAPKTAGPVTPGPKDTGKISYPYLPVQARPVLIQTGFRSNFDSATGVPASAASTLRFGSLW